MQTYSPSSPTYVYNQQSHYSRQEPSFSREFTDLSSITLETDEEEALHGDRYTYAPEEPHEELWGARFAKVGVSLLVVAAGCAVAAMVLGTMQPLRSTIPVTQENRLNVAGRVLTGRQLMESPELTDLATNRLEGDKYFVDDTEELGSSPEVRRELVRVQVAADFRDVASRAGGQLDTIQLSEVQRHAIFQVLNHISDDARMQNVGMQVAQAMRDSIDMTRHPGDRARYVMNRLKPSMPEVRRLREEVLPAPLRQGGQPNEVRIVKVLPLLGHAWRFEVDADLAQTSEDDHSAALRKLQQTSSFTADGNTLTPPKPPVDTSEGGSGHFITEMRKFAQEARTALDTLNKDLGSSITGLTNAAEAPPSEAADKGKSAKQNAYNTVQMATNAMETVSNSLSNMLDTCRHSKKNRTKMTGPTGTMTKKVFKELVKSVNRVEQNCNAAKSSFETDLTTMKPLVDSDSNSSVQQVKATTSTVQTQVMVIEAETKAAFKEFKVLYQIYNGNAGVMDTVRLYSSSLLSQMGMMFNTSFPDVGPANDEMNRCVQNANSFTADLKCKLVYGRTCLELMQGGSLEPKPGEKVPFEEPPPLSR